MQVRRLPLQLITLTGHIKDWPDFRKAQARSAVT
jgi:hypothetical protein